MLNYKAQLNKAKRFSMFPLTMAPEDNNSNSRVEQGSINHPYTAEDQSKFEQRYFQPSTRRRNTTHSNAGRKAINVLPFQEDLQDKNHRPKSEFLADSIKTSDYQKLKNGNTDVELVYPVPRLGNIVAGTVATHLHGFLKGDKKDFLMKDDNLSTDSLLGTADDLLLQLLISQAIVETKPFRILTLEAMEQYKKEKEMNHTKLEALSNKLLLELKVRDGAKALIKMYGNNKKMVSQAQEQVLAATRKLEEVSREIWKLYTRSFELHHILMVHNASVLGAGYQRQERNVRRLKESIILREGQDAVKDETYLESQSSAESIDTPLSTVELQRRLTDALNLISTQQNQIDQLKKGQQAGLDITLEKVLAKLDTSQARIMELEKQLTSHITSRSVSSVGQDSPQQEEIIGDSSPTNDNVEHQELLDQLAQKTEEIDKLRQQLQQSKSSYTSLATQHNQLLAILEELYHEIPEVEAQVDGPDFSIPSFIERVDALMLENLELIERVIQLQSINTKENKSDEILDDIQKNDKNEGEIDILKRSLENLDTSSLSDRT